MRSGEVHKRKVHKRDVHKRDVHSGEVHKGEVHKCEMQCAPVVALLRDLSWRRWLLDRDADE